MKRLLLITAIVVVGFSNANAQDVQLGAKYGINFSDTLLVNYSN